MKNLILLSLFSLLGFNIQAQDDIYDEPAPVVERTYSYQNDNTPDPNQYDQNLDDYNPNFDYRYSRNMRRMYDPFYTMPMTAQMGMYSYPQFASFYDPWYNPYGNGLMISVGNNWGWNSWNNWNRPVGYYAFDPFYSNSYPFAQNNCYNSWNSYSNWGWNSWNNNSFGYSCPSTYYRPNRPQSNNWNNQQQPPRQQERYQTSQSRVERGPSRFVNRSPMPTNNQPSTNSPSNPAPQRPINTSSNGGGVFRSSNPNPSPAVYDPQPASSNNTPSSWNRSSNSSNSNSGSVSQPSNNNTSNQQQNVASPRGQVQSRGGRF